MPSKTPDEMVQLPAVPLQVAFFVANACNAVLAKLQDEPLPIQAEMMWASRFAYVQSDTKDLSEFNKKLTQLLTAADPESSVRIFRGDDGL